MATFPANIRTFVPVVDQTDTVWAVHMNDVRDEVVAIQTVLGANPQGGATSPATVSKRVADLESGKSATSHTHGFDVAAHDVVARHTFGAGLGTPPTPTTLTVGSAGAVGTHANPARGDHDHPFPSAAVLANNIIPVGTIVMTAGTNAPTGWLMCDGTEVANATYPALGTLLGVAGASRYGAAAAGNVKLPNLISRFPMGAASAGAAVAAGGSANAALVSHSHAGSAVIDGTAPHTHGYDHGHTTGDAGSHAHNVGSADVGDTGSAVIGVSTGFVNSSQNRWVNYTNPDGANLVSFAQIRSVGNHNHGATNTLSGSVSGGASGTNATHGHGLTIVTEGVSATNANLPPYQTVNFMIKAH